MSAKQQETFVRWINAQLTKGGEEERVSNLDEDLKNGIILIKLMKCVNPASMSVLKKYNHNPKNEIHCNDNLSLAFNMIAHAQVKTIGVGPHDVYKTNPKLVLGLIWSIIYAVQVGGIKGDDSKKGGKDGLLLWAKRHTANYDGVEVKNFTTSWQGGKALCALAHSVDTSAFDYSEMAEKPAAELIEFAFAQLESKWNVPRLLDVDALVDMVDEKSLMTYISEIYHAFAKQAGSQTKKKRLSNFYQSIKASTGMTDGYEKGMQSLLDWATSATERLGNIQKEGKLTELKESLDAVNAMKSERREQAGKLTDVEVMLANIANVNKANNRQEYVPDESLQLTKAIEAFEKLDDQAAEVGDTVRANYRKAKDEICKIYVGTSKKVFDYIRNQTKQLTRQSLAGSWDEQLKAVDEILAKLSSDEDYNTSKDAAEQIDGAGISFDDIDGAQVSWAELKWEWEKLEKNLRGKKVFIEAQVAAAAAGNVSAEKVAEYQETFQMFDGDKDGNLVFEEFLDCIKGLGNDLSEADAEAQFKKFATNAGTMSFEKFLAFMSDQTSDKQTFDQVLEAFRSMAASPDFITKQELTAGLSAEEAEFFAKAMPAKGDGFDYKTYLQGMYKS